MKTKELTLMAIMLALLIVCSQLAIPIGPVPITLQTFCVLLIGMLLSPKQAFIVTATYTLLGLIGLPVFAGFKGGFHSVFSLSFGFVISFIVASTVLAILTQSNKGNFKHNLFAGMIASFIIYAVGLPYMSIIFNHVMEVPKSFTEVVALGMTPFLIGDLIKLVFAATIVNKLYHPFMKRFAY